MLTLSIPEKLKNPIFEMPIIPPTLNINNLRTTRVGKVYQPIYHQKSYGGFFKKQSVKAMFTVTIFRILSFEGRSVLSPAQHSTGSKSVKVSVTSP